MNSGYYRNRFNHYAAIKTALLVMLCISIASCGFTLRGSVEIPDSLKRVYFSAPNETAAVKSAKRLLKSNGVTLVASPDAAPYHLQVLKESNRRRSATLTSQAKTEEYELRSSLIFQVTDRDKKIVLKPVTLLTERVYSFDENNITAKDEEEALLRREMHNNLAGQLIRRYLGLAGASR